MVKWEYMKKKLVFLAMFMGVFSLAMMPVGEASAEPASIAITREAAQAKCESAEWGGTWSKSKNDRCVGLKKNKESVCKEAHGTAFEKIQKGDYKDTYRCVWSSFSTTPNDVGGTAGSTDAVECGKGFLGFSPWYRGLTTLVNGRCEVMTPNTANNGLTVFVITIILNILGDLTLAVGYLALGFIIYGGFLYVMAGGDPGKVAKGKKTLMAAVIGTAIAMLSSVILNLIVGALTGTS